ncbi:MAG: hypothetical protein Q9227_007480 [Pyrenula ochraceoflavens]
MFASKRLGKELQKIHKGLPPGITLVKADDFRQWWMDIRVLDGNPIYKDQVFRLQFVFTNQYPIGTSLVLPPLAAREACTSSLALVFLPQKATNPLLLQYPIGVSLS